MVINPKIASTIMATGMQRWNGTIISPDIERVIFYEDETQIICNDGCVIYFDGNEFYEK